MYCTTGRRTSYYPRPQSYSVILSFVMPGWSSANIILFCQLASCKVLLMESTRGRLRGWRRKTGLVPFCLLPVYFLWASCPWFLWESSLWYFFTLRVAVSSGESSSVQFAVFSTCRRSITAASPILRSLYMSASTPSSEAGSRPVSHSEISTADPSSSEAWPSPPRGSFFKFLSLNNYNLFPLFSKS